uniref:Small ribosomal subunit protein bS6 n=1 Tax=candidate division WOR-3 bacterium TaxID=2052148 RepID=A0A7C4TAD2_UNCW3
MMRNYEGMFIFHPSLDEENLQQEIQMVEKLIKENGEGNVKYEIIGKKTLAYPVKKENSGYYVNFQFECPPAAIGKIKDGLKHKGNILRFIFFKIQK